MSNLGTTVDYILKQRGFEDVGVVRDDGDGPYIARWDPKWGEQPTETEIANTESAALAAVAQKHEADNLVEKSGYSLKELVLALVLNDSTVLRDAREKIAAP